MPASIADCRLPIGDSLGDWWIEALRNQDWSNAALIDARLLESALAG
jgi:hypothetical protein